MKNEINIKNLVDVLKENGCTLCDWKNFKCDDYIIIDSCKACFNQNTCLKNRKRIRRVRLHFINIIT
jgi:hypothetical protein